MKKFLFIYTFVLVFTGCSRNVQPQHPQVVYVREAPKDNFDIVGDAVGDAGRWSWNKAKGAYEWVTSEENKGRAERAWKTTKEGASELYDKAKEKMSDL